MTETRGATAAAATHLRATEAPPAIAVSDLTVAYHDKPVLWEVDLAVPPGVLMAIVGPNGAGKTTLFNLISGELRPSGGTMCFEGVDITRMPLEARVARGIGRTFQHSDLFPALTAVESVTLAVQQQRRWSHHLIPRRRDADVVGAACEILERVGLQDEMHTPVRDLSHGAQRQLELALALGTGPKLLLLDEPTAGLSPRETDAFVELVSSLTREVTIVIIEHDMNVVFSLADRLTVMHNGTVLASGEPDAVSEIEKVQEIYLGTHDV
jgi:branched-chain amino acid transport system ATP-binding protein